MRGDNTVRSKSLDVAHGRLAKEAAVFSVELADALVSDLVSCARGVHPVSKASAPLPSAASIAFGIEEGSSRSMRGIDDEVLKLRSSGVMTFIVTEDGVVYQKDLGRKTDVLARGMKEYDPNPSWQKPEEQQ